MFFFFDSYFQHGLSEARKGRLASEYRFSLPFLAPSCKKSMVPISGPLWKSPCYRGEKLFFLIRALHSVQSPVSLGSEGFGDDVRSTNRSTLGTGIWAGHLIWRAC